MLAVAMLFMINTSFPRFGNRRVIVKDMSSEFVITTLVIVNDQCIHLVISSQYFREDLKAALFAVLEAEVFSVPKHIRSK